VPLSSLSITDIARSASKTVTSGPSGWSRFYAFLIAGDDKGWKQMKVQGPDLTELQTDAEQWYPNAFKLAAASKMITAIAAKPLPTDKRARPLCVASLKELMAQYSEVDAVVPARRGSN
jgi:hypothetical protein